MTTANPTTAPADPAGPVVHDENPDMETMDPEETQTYFRAIEENYAQYRATGPITWGNALAFNRGDAVPADYPTLAELLDEGRVEAVEAPAGSRRSKRK